MRTPPGGGRPPFDEGPPVVSFEDLAQRMMASRLPRRLGTIMVLAAIAFFLVVIGGPAINLYTDWLWFTSLGYGSVFSTRLAASLVVGAITGAVFLLISLPSVVVALRVSGNRRLAVYGVRQRVLATPLGVVMLLLILITTLGFAAFGGSTWPAVLRALHAHSFGSSDPIFHLDAGFYVFTLPLYDTVVGLAITIIVVTAVLTGLVYYVRLARTLTNMRPPVGLVRHGSLLGAALALLMAVGSVLAGFHLLTGHRTVVHGAGYTDVFVRLPGLYILAVLMTGAAVLLLVNLRLRRLWPFVAALGIWIIGSAILSGIAPALVQRLAVQPAELSIERPYIANEIKGSRQGFGIGSVADTPFQPTPSVTAADVAGNAASLGNVRLWDYAPLLSTYSQIQSFRTYYDFHDVDIDRYQIDGQLRQVMLAARELDIGHLPTAAQTWVNQHVKYTHGYGAVVNKVTDSTPEGLPQLLLHDIPPVGVPQVTQPAIYFGEVDNAYALVGTTEQEFDYPGTQDAYAHWQGSTGIALDSPWRKLAFALNLGDLNLLISSQTTSATKILVHRQISERNAALAPFLEYDRDPYLVISQGRMFWVQDAYTTAAEYPYSATQTDAAGNDINYIRNSVKVVTDAYSGRVDYYISDPADPIIATYADIFPGLFHPLSDMSADLRAHLRYPVDLFSLQAQVYALYHMTDPQVFYNREDAWTLPQQVTVQASSTGVMEPYYVIMKYPGQVAPEFLLILPMTPSNKSNMITLLAARNDGTHYGELADLRFSKDNLVFGPQQIEGRIDQEPVIKSQLALLNQPGSQVLRGNLLVIPLDHSLLYVEPLYLEAQGGSSLPELRKVIVADGQHVAMADTLGQALSQLLGEAPAVAPTTPSPSPPVNQSNAAVVAAANDEYAKALQALKAGDFTAFGQHLDALGRLLSQLKAQQAGTP